MVSLSVSHHLLKGLQKTNVTTRVITTQWQITKVIIGMNFATLFIIKYKFDKFNSENNKRTKDATAEIQQALVLENFPTGIIPTAEIVT